MKDARYLTDAEAAALAAEGYIVDGPHDSPCICCATVIIQPEFGGLGKDASGWTLGQIPIAQGDGTFLPSGVDGGTW